MYIFFNFYFYISLKNINWMVFFFFRYFFLKFLIRNEILDFELKLSSGYFIFLYLYGFIGIRFVSFSCKYFMVLLCFELMFIFFSFFFY